VSSAPISRAELAGALAPELLSADAAAALPVRGRKKAGVLVPLFVSREAALSIVMTRRGDNLRRHAGELSFPGGRVDDDDVDLRATALREANEEIGLAPPSVDLIGALAPTPTIATGYAVHPFVGLIEPDQEWVLSQREVASIHEFDVTELLAGYGRRRVKRRGVGFTTDTYVVNDQLVWGATARILGDLFARLEAAGLS
jgi:8-oxo-dGTP pyrophosphatase MutT (NUDIX family)